MTKRDRSHARRLLRRLTLGVVALLVLSLAGAAVGYWPDIEEQLGVSEPEPTGEAPELDTPAALEFPVQPAAGEVAAPLTSGTVDPAAVRRALTQRVGDRSLGRRVAVGVAEGPSGTSVYASGGQPTTPASTMKLLTCLAALETLGVDHRFETRVVRVGRRLVLVGGGDPLLAAAPSLDAYPQRADVTTLARRTAHALRLAGIAKVRLGYDTSLFAGPTVEDSWEPDYVVDNVVTPITSLWINEGRVRAGAADRSDDPSGDAARAFAAALEAEGIAVAGEVRTTSAPDDAETTASVQSAPLAELVEHVLEVSDNEAAEVLAHQVAVAVGRVASFEGASAAVRGVLADLGVTMRGALLEDGSGLSRANRLTPATLLDVLHTAATRPELRAVLTGLPVAGFNGSLAFRFQTAPAIALGEVRAKTGTLTGVSALAGTVVTRDGLLLSFVAMADRIRVADTLDARAALDEIAGALAACVCGSAG